MARFDLVVKNGLVVVPYVGELRMDIGIRDERIAALEESIDSADADELLDATGKAVLPGGVDSHFHLGIYRDIAEDAESETTSSAVGGVTTAISLLPHRAALPEQERPLPRDLPGGARSDRRPRPDRLRLPSRADDRRAHHGDPVAGLRDGRLELQVLHVLQGLQPCLGQPRRRVVHHVRGLRPRSPVRDHGAGRRGRSPEPGRISVCLHCEQAELLRVFIERAKADSRLSGLAEYNAARPPLTERLSIEEAGVLADATQVNLNLLHLSSELALQDRRGRGAPLSAAGRGAGDDGAPPGAGLRGPRGKGLGGKVNPPIRTRSDNEALWEGLRHGLVTTVASDHACCMEDWKGEDLWPALPGFGGTALLYPVLISEGVHKRGLPLSRIVEVASAAPAQAYNLYPRKGTIAVGSDADLAIVDLEPRTGGHHRACRSAQDHTPFEGIAVKGWPTDTILRGRPVLRDGDVVDGARGQYIHRSGEPARLGA